MDKKMMAASTSMLLLKLLEEEDMYGYQMIRKLEERSDNVFSLKEGTMYPILHALEEEGAVESYEKDTEILSSDQEGRTSAEKETGRMGAV